MTGFSSYRNEVEPALRLVTIFLSVALVDQRAEEQTFFAFPKCVKNPKLNPDLARLV